MDIIDTAVNGRTIKYKKEIQVSLPPVEIEKQLIQANDKILKLNTDIEIIRNQINSARVCNFYFDTGNDFSEKEKINIQHKRETVNFCHEIELPQNIKAVRFDPVEGCGCFLQSLVIKSDNGETVNYQIMNGFRTENDGIVFTTADPQILVNLNESNIKKITVECNIWLFN